MLFMLLLGCRGYFDSVPPETILDEIVGRWWYMTDHTEYADNFYLELVEEDGEDSGDVSTENGNIWLDFVNGPVPRIASNVRGGTWSLVWDGQVEVVDEYFDTDGTYEITVKEEAKVPGCFDVVVDWSFRITDTICPYEGE